MNDDSMELFNVKVKEQAEAFGGRLDIDDWKYIQLLASDTDEMLGRVCGYNDSSSVGTIFVEDLWVDNSMRNKGVASFLMKTFEQLALQHGINKVRLFASGSGDLFSFYEKLGYSREAPTSTIMIKNLTSALSQENALENGNPKKERRELEQSKAQVEMLANVQNDPTFSNGEMNQGSTGMKR